MQRLDVALASMDIDSAVTADREGVVVINRRCPYVEQAAEGGVRPESVCEMLCGASSSLFQGMSRGLPSTTRYEPTAMMGRGDAACVKRFWAAGEAPVVKPAA